MIITQNLFGMYAYRINFRKLKLKLSFGIQGGMQVLNNDLTSLPINQNVNLESLNCFGNYLNSLDMSQIPLLMSLNCGNNILFSLERELSFFE